MKNKRRFLNREIFGRDCRGKGGDFSIVITKIQS